jgi:hypothetical protein
MDEEAVWEDLRLFIKEYFNLLSYENFIKDIVGKKKKESKHINTLEEACKPKAYEPAILWFKNEGLIYPDTLEWKDQSLGCKGKLAKYIWSLKVFH